MKLSFILLISLLPLLGIACTENTTSTNTTKASDPCDGPDADIECAFANMPGSISSTIKIANDDEAGERMIITGRLLHKDGTTPFAGVLIYVYHTDRNGNYPKKGNETGVQKWHGYLHGWGKTNANGEYVINTIRPAQYPSRDQPAHIHAHIKEPGQKAYYITDFLFKDDPLAVSHSNNNNIPGGSGVIDLKKDNNTWNGTRDIILKN